MKKGLSESSASTQISDILPTDQEQEEEFDFSSECYISLIVPFLAYIIINTNFLKSFHIRVALAFITAREQTLDLCG